MIETSSDVRIIVDAWIDGDNRVGTDGRTVFAEHDAGDNIREVYGFTGNSDSGELHEFADSTEAEDFAETIRRRGYIRITEYDNVGGDWALVDILDRTGWDD